VIDELAALPDRPFVFIDDNLIGERSYARRLFEAMIPLGRRWVTQASIQLSQEPELLALAARAGCRGVFVGLESVNEPSLTGAQKTHNRVETYGDSVKALHDHGICVQAGVVFGFDEDDQSIFERTLETLDQIGVDILQAAVLTPLPGTRLHARLRAEGRIFDNDWGHYDCEHTVYTPRHMRPEDLEDGRNWVIHQFYGLPRVARRIVSGLARGNFDSTLLMSLPINAGYYAHAKRYIPDSGLPKKPA
jgi:radical SAM superfamily enzyme YgiQ (UPF0313 family)